jgi:hypothetical protein
MYVEFLVRLTPRSALLGYFSARLVISCCPHQRARSSSLSTRGPGVSVTQMPDLLDLGVEGGEPDALLDVG